MENTIVFSVKALEKSVIKHKIKKLKKLLTFVEAFDMIYLAAENGGNKLQKSLKKIKKVVDKRKQLW